MAGEKLATAEKAKHGNHSNRVNGAHFRIVSPSPSRLCTQKVMK